MATRRYIQTLYENFVEKHSKKHFDVVIVRVVQGGRYFSFSVAENCFFYLNPER
jgi:hypothetical protein